MGARRILGRASLALCVGVWLDGVAMANMPVLTEEPSSRSPEACEKWAAAQDDEAISMWGVLESGERSDPIGLKRLALFCLGDSKPEIVGFGSSAAFDEAYCRKNGHQPICGREQSSKAQPRKRGGPLPFPDGRYVVDAALCALTMEQIYDKLGDGMEAQVRTIEGATLGGFAEKECEVSRAREARGKILFEGRCEAEGDDVPLKGVWTRVAIDAFSVGGKTFELCKASTR